MRAVDRRTGLGARAESDARSCGEGSIAGHGGPPHNGAVMKNLLTALVVSVSLFAFAGCASQSKAAGPNGACCNTCPVSDEALTADSPVVDYNGVKVGFCCKKCLGAWEKMPDAEKKEKFDACCAKCCDTK